MGGNLGGKIVKRRVQASWLRLAISPCGHTLPSMFLPLPAGTRTGTAQYASTGGALASTAGAVLTLAVAGRLAWFTGMAVTSSRRRRARHDEVLDLVGRRGPVPGLVLLEDDRPAGYKQGPASCG